MRPTRKMVIVQEQSILELKCSSPDCHMKYAVTWIRNYDNKYSLEQCVYSEAPDYCPYCGQKYREDKYFERVA